MVSIQDITGTTSTNPHAHYRSIVAFTDYNTYKPTQSIPMSPNSANPTAISDGVDASPVDSITAEDDAYGSVEPSSQQIYPSDRGPSIQD